MATILIDEVLSSLLNLRQIPFKDFQEEQLLSAQYLRILLDLLVVVIGLAVLANGANRLYGFQLRRTAVFEVNVTARV